MMASGLIFFAQTSPPNPKGFYIGTLGSALAALGFTFVSSSLSLAMVAGIASGESLSAGKDGGM